MTTFFEYYQTKAANNTVSSVDMVILATAKALRAKRTDKLALLVELLKRSFSPITKPTKLADGAQRYQALNQAIRLAKFYLVRNGYSSISVEEQEALHDLLSTLEAII